jgi:hypothetical protein
MKGPLKVLFLAAEPDQMEARLRIDREIRDVVAAVRKTKGGERLEITAALAIRTAELQAALHHHRPDVVHFSGHGKKGTGILMDDDGIVRAPPLVGLFRTFSDVHLVVLNACDTLRIADALVQVVDYAVGMNGPVTDEAAIAFSAAFYGALAAGSTVPKAFDCGVNQLQLLDISGDRTPTLRFREGVRHEPLVEPDSAHPTPSGEPGYRTDISLHDQARAGTIANVNGANSTVHIGGQA